MSGAITAWQWEVRLMTYLQTYASAFLVAAASFFTVLGQEGVAIAVIGYFYWGKNKRYGRLLGFNILSAALLNPMLKNIFMRRRPYFDHPEIQCLKAVHSGDLYDVSIQGYSFPSGHSANSAAFYGTLGITNDKKVFKILGILLPFLIGVSRVILGVHYPTDVLAGWFFGGFCTLFLSDLQRKTSDIRSYYLWIFLFALIGLFYARTEDYFTCLGMQAGFFIGDIVEERYVQFHNSDNPLICLLRLASAVLIFFLMNVLLKKAGVLIGIANGSFAGHLYRSLRYGLMMFILIGVYPRSFSMVEKWRNRHA